MDFDAALRVIDGLSGAGVDLGGADPAYPDFPREEHQRRYARLSALMEQEGLEAIVLTQEEPIRYFSGYTSVIWAVGRWLPGAFIATRDPRQAVLVPSAFDVGAVRGTSWVETVDGHADPAEIPGKVREHLARLGITAVGMEWGPGAIVMLPFPVARALADAVGAGARDASRLVSAVRMLKSDAERERIRRATRATVAGYRAALEGAKAGMTEKELVALCGSTAYANGLTAGTRPLFLNCVAGPDRYSLVDTTASDRALRDGDVVFLDGGGGSDGYMSDIIRLIAVGDIGVEKERLASLAQDALHAALDAIRPGVKASAVFEAGIGVYEEAGLGAFAGGIAGHGIGLEIWERPFIRRHDDPEEDVTIRADMTLCIEPILVPPGDDGAPAGVFVFEQQVAVTTDGYELLSEGLEPSLWRAPA